MLSTIPPASGKLLISEPFMADPNFKRSVVLLCEYTDEGAVGYVLNQLTEYILKDVLPDCWDADFPVYVGGPVGRDTLHFIHRCNDKIPGGKQIAEELFWGGDFESLKIQVNNYNIKSEEIRFFIGYSGWDAEQLLNEVNQNAWIVANLPDVEMIFTDTEENFWRKAVKNLGKKYEHIINFPENPELN